MSGDSLNCYIKSHKFNKISFFTNISRIFHGIDYLHAKKLIHRDIKPSNILIDHNGIPYISDYETIRTPDSSEGPFTNDIGSQIFASPEQYNGEDVSYPTDIFSYGQIIKYLCEETKFVSTASIRSLFEKCIQPKPKERIQNEEIKKILNNEFNSFKYIEHYLFSYKTKINKTQISNFIFEKIFIQQPKETITLCHTQIKQIRILLFFIDIKFNSIFLFQLGNLYENGFGVKQDYSEAIKYYELSAKLNNSSALLYLGVLYENGLGIKQDYSEAIKYYELSAKLNNSYALFNLGSLYLNGFGVKQDYSEAIKYYELSAKLNNSYALFNLGSLYLNGFGVKQDYSKAIKYYELSAKLNNSYALYNLGTLYLNGHGVKQDYSEAIKYYELSAKLNNSSALFNLGKLYLNGFGVKQDYSKAIKYYELSAQLNNSNALIILGDIYSNIANFQEAMEYFQKSISIERGIKIEYNIINKINKSFFEPNNYRYISYNDLGLIFITEFKDIQKAEDNLKESFYAEYPFVQNSYGLLNEFYLNEINKAEYMYGRSSGHNFSLAEFNLGRIQEKNKKPKESIKYYILASEHEDEPLVYRGITRFDLRLKISKTFIMCFTNLTLTEHYFTQDNYEESKKYFIRSFRKLELITEDLEYKFEYKIEIKNETSENYSFDIFSYLKKFILNFPKFKLNIQPNLKGKPYSNIFEHNGINISQNENEMISFNEVHNSTDKLSKENKFDDKKDNNFDQKEYLLSNKIVNFATKFNEKEENTKFSINKYKTEKKQESKVKIFDNPGDLFDFVIGESDSKSKPASETESNTKSESKLKTIFINEIRDIISIMKDILYTEPYPILFGRITIMLPKKEEKQVDLREEIDDSFRNGFYLQ